MDISDKLATQVIQLPNSLSQPNTTGGKDEYIIVFYAEIVTDITTRTQNEEITM
jgi:hypothetical protein